jgi:hypothetical protein
MVHHCEKCGRRKRQNKQEAQMHFKFREDVVQPQHNRIVFTKTSPIDDKDEPKHLVPNRYNSPHRPNKYNHNKKSDDDSTAAILARVDENVEVRGKINFTVGISNNRSFKVSDDGSEFIITKDGFYRLIFTGRMTNQGKLIFDRSPSVRDKQKQFSEASFGGDITMVSTMLPFKEGYRLSIRFRSREMGVNVLEGGAQLEIYRVDDL